MINYISNKKINYYKFWYLIQKIVSNYRNIFKPVFKFYSKQIIATVINLTINYHKIIREHIYIQQFYFFYISIQLQKIILKEGW